MIIFYKRLFDDDLLRYSGYVVAAMGQTNVKLSTNYSATVQEPERMGIQ